MRKALLLSGHLLLVLGSVLLVGAYLVFNKYSISGSKHFNYRDTWILPEIDLSSLELSEGDTVTVEISVSGIGNGTLFIANTPPNRQRLPLSELGNRTVYYYIPSDNLYYFYTVVDWVSPPRGVDLTLNVEVTRKAPDPIFPLLGGIILLAGAVTISIAFLYKNRYPKQPTT